MAAAARDRRPIGSRLDNLTPDWDDLVRDAKLGIPSVRKFDDLEERAQAFCDAVIAIFRGARP